MVFNGDKNGSKCNPVFGLYHYGRTLDHYVSKCYTGFKTLQYQIDTL